MFTILGKKWRKAEIKMADILTALSGSMSFVYLHVLLFTIFFIIRPFAVEVFNVFLSLEAVFLATFIMVSQNRQAEIAEERAEEEGQEEEEFQEEIEEEFEDIQEDFDSLKKDLDEMRSLIKRLETRLPEREQKRRDDIAKEKVTV